MAKKTIKGDICWKCKKTVPDTAAVKVGKDIKWICYHCYKTWR